MCHIPGVVDDIEFCDTEIESIYRVGAREYPLSLRDAYRDVGGRATHGAVAERARERGFL
jgi:hypothetical protein